MTMRLTDEQVEWLARRVPDAPRSPRGGRPAMDKRQALRERQDTREAARAMASRRHLGE